MADLPILTIYDCYTQTVQVVSKVILGAYEGPPPSTREAPPSTPLPVSSNTVRSAYQDPVFLL